MKLRRKTRGRLDPSMLRLPLVALIDVVLFLLFYFMIAGNIDMEEAELEATLALVGGGSGKPSESFLDAQVLQVGSDVQGPIYRIGGRELRDRLSLQGLLQGLPKEAGVVIKSSATVAFETVAGALQVAHDAGFTKITYVPEG
jgi:biopolymer transport protein ExbD